MGTQRWREIREGKEKKRDGAHLSNREEDRVAFMWDPQFHVKRTTFFGI